MHKINENNMHSNPLNIQKIKVIGYDKKCKFDVKNVIL